VVRVSIGLRTDPVLKAAVASRLTVALRGRLTEADVAALGREDLAGRVSAARSHGSERRTALQQLNDVARAVHQTQAPVVAAILRAGGQVLATTAIGNRITATLPATALARLAERSDVAWVRPAPVEAPMGIASATAAVGAPSFWSAGISGTNPEANGGAGVNLAIESDKLQEDHPAFAGIDFERWPGVGTGTPAGSYSGANGYDHGTAVASFAIARGASGCSGCVPSDADEQGVAPYLDHVLDNATDATPGAPATDPAAWQLGIEATVWNNATQSYDTVPGAPYPAEVASDSHGGYTTEDDSVVGQGLDNWVSTFGLTTTEPSGNDGENGTGSGHITDTCLAYDVICVGGVDYHGTIDASDDTVGTWSSKGPSPAGRRKPDLVANGQPTGYARRDWWNGLWQSNTWGTSYASPQVAGGAALLYSAGITDPMAIKAVLIDSARQGRAPGCTPSPCAMGTQAGWQPDWGFGELDLTDAYAERTQFAEGSVSAGSARFYRANVQQAGDRATLVWNRRAVGCLDPGCSTTSYTLTNLDLKQLAPDCAVQATSASSIDNVEQVRAAAGDVGEVLYDVEANSNVEGVPAEPFSLAGTQQPTPLVSPAPSVLVTPSSSHVSPGQDVTVTATVANPSPDLTADQTTVSLNLPAGVELVEGDLTQQLGSLAQQGRAGDRTTASWIVRASRDGTSNLTATADAKHCGEEFSGSSDMPITASTPQPPVGSGEGGSAPGGPTGGGQPSQTTPTPGKRSLASPRLHVARRWSSKGLRISGTLARGATGRITVTYRATVRGRHKGKVTRVRVHAGRFVALIRVHRSRAHLSVTYQGDRNHRSQTVRLTVH
jgi:hypothetical protein